MNYPLTSECHLNSLVHQQDNKQRHISLSVILSVCAILGAQRFLLPGIYAYICIIPLLLAFFVFFSNKHKPLRNTLVIISLFLSVDNGADIFQITPGFLRYLIYLVCFYIVIENHRFSIGRCLIMIVVGCIYTIQTAVSEVPIDPITLTRDILLFVIITAIFCRSSGTRFIGFKIGLLTCFLLIFSLTEVANSILFFTIDLHGYMNYDSSKSLIVLVSFYFIAKKKPLLAVMAFILTIFVLISYGTRMILLTYIAAIAIFLIMHNFRSLFKMVAIALLLILPALVFISKNETQMKSYKAVAFLTQIESGQSLTDVFKSMDRVRYEETKLFFSRDLYPLIFGSGLGSGLHDQENVFGFVSIYQTAFSEKELASGYFYNLHDTWIDIGLRFGFGFILLLYYILVIEINNKGPYRSMMAMNLLVLVSCASFSSGGLLLIAIMYLVMINPAFSIPALSKRHKVSTGSSEDVI